MQRVKEIPKNPRFQLATQKAYELLADLEIGKFPVDPRQIIKAFPNWFLCGWVELQVAKDEEDPLFLDKEKSEAKTVKLRNGKNEYLIVYDDRISDARRIRWTFAHEIGHIVLGHVDHFEATALNRRGLTKDEYGVLEIEAHWFAAELLAPETILRRFNFEGKPQGISLICDISKEAAEKRLKKIARKLPSYPLSTENRIFRNFAKHLFSGEYYQSMHKTACRFAGTSIFPDLCKECRICRNCNSFVTDESYTYCHTCGAEVPTPQTYSPYNNGNPIKLSHLYLKGVSPYSISFSKGRADYCPICKNISEKEACEVCSTPLINRCIRENKVLSYPHKYCPDCGGKTTYTDIYANLPERLTADNIIIPDSYDDYIEYDFLEFIRLTVGFWEKNLALYAAIEDSVAFYDYADMVLFVCDAKAKHAVEQSLDCLLKCISKHAEAPIAKITVMVAAKNTQNELLSKMANG